MSRPLRGAVKRKKLNTTLDPKVIDLAREIVIAINPALGYGVGVEGRLSLGRKTKMKYQIRYQHTSYSSASSKDEALAAVRREARVTRLAIAEVADGTYCYRSRADMDSDDTGAGAFAVICEAGQQND